MTRIVIYTDLDGTLLDHDTYSWAPATSMLGYLSGCDVPVVPCTSKTRAELLPLRSAMGLDTPFIVENGAAVWIPESMALAGTSDLPHIDGFLVKTFVDKRSRWLDLIENTFASLGKRVARGFAEMSVDEIAALTGLDPLAAARAAAREYGEPLYWLLPPPDRESFRSAIESQGGVILQGGRFAHVSGATDKGRALQWLQSRYAASWGALPLSIAAGDSGNDVAMLEAADWALLVRSPVNSVPALRRTRQTVVSETEGPSGWSQGMSAILAHLGFGQPAPKT